MQHLKQLIEFSAYNLLVLKEDEIVGFIICMREGAAYWSENYQFFTKRLKSFSMSIEWRLMSATEEQAWDKLYMKTIFSQANNESLPVALEVNTQPVNQPSLNFHEKMGFDQVGTREFDDHSVAYFIK
jgi:predicted GNAT superfamily acetyltransferase